MRVPPFINIALLIPRTEAEGPGMRFALWVQGCPMRCPGCCNPEFLPFVPNQEVPAEELAQRALAAGVEGVSFLGGEPFSQAEGLAYLARRVRSSGLSVMVFSGYTLEEIERLPDPGARALLAETDLLVDGRYENERRTTTRRWVGSENQVLHFLSDRYQPEDPRFSEGNHLEIRLSSRGEIILNGFPSLGARTRIVGPVREPHSVAGEGASGPSASLPPVATRDVSKDTPRQGALRADPDSPLPARSGALEQALK